MKRWNGWGEENITYPLKTSLKEMLLEHIGEGKCSTTIPKEDILKHLPSSPLKDIPGISTSSVDRLYHCRGQSLPDWIELRFGRIRRFPDGVFYPTTEQEVAWIIKKAKEGGFCLIPYGGGTSVLGHINPIDPDRPIVTVSMERLQGLVDINEYNRCATFYSGTPGPGVEKDLKKWGYTLGHFPQSFEFSTLGGWVATKSSGQQSLGYGRIDNMFMGGRLNTPRGIIEVPSIPASAAGPDLKEMILGSEGRIGILSTVQVRISPLPEREVFAGFFLPSWEAGISVVKILVQESFFLSMLRLSNPKETKVHLAMAGDKLKGLIVKYLKLRGLGGDVCLLVVGISGSKGRVKRTYRRVRRLVQKHKGISASTFIGRAWQKNRFKAPYLRNTLWEEGYAVDTLETCVPWDRIDKTMKDIEKALEMGLEEEGERVYVFSHLSHFYITGASIYTTYLYRIAPDFETTLARFERLKHKASMAILRNGGTISHHHGVGLDHKRYMDKEKTVIGMAVLRDLISSFDPYGIMNPGKLV